MGSWVEWVAQVGGEEPLEKGGRGVGAAALHVELATGWCGNHSQSNTGMGHTERVLP